MEAHPTTAGEIDEPDWGRLEGLLADFARTAKSSRRFSEVTSELLDCLVEPLESLGAALWMTDDEGRLRLERQTNIGILGDAALAGEHQRFVEASMQAGRAEAFPPLREASGSNPTNYHLLLAPIVIDAQAVGAIEVVQRPGVAPDALDGNRRFVALLAELVADHLRRRELRELKAGRTNSAQFEEFLLSLNQAPNARETAARLANEGRRLLHAGRVSVALRRGKRSRVVAVSAVDKINRRSTAVRRLQRLVDRVVATGEPFWYDGDDQDLPPQLHSAVTEHLDESHARCVGVLPLTSASSTRSAGRRVFGALVVEGFDADDWDAVRSAAPAFAEHGALAIANALRSARWFGGRGVSGEPTHRTAKACGGLLVAGVIASTFFVEADFKVYAEGELQPVGRRHVFAPMDGDVSKVHVARGDTVAAGEPLATIDSSELDLAMQKVRGEHEATRKRSLAIESALLEYGSSVDADPAAMNQLAAEQEELKQLFESHQQRLETLRRERDKLIVRSPLDGEVLTWEADEDLLNRPVKRGERLMTVADLAGEWEAELRAADEEVGPLLKAFAESSDAVEAGFSLATDRRAEHEGLVTHVARRAEIDPQGRPVVRIAMQVDRTALADPRPGATVYAAIPCGRRSLFYVWCHEIIDRVYGWFHL